jgi:hemoglobin
MSHEDISLYELIGEEGFTRLVHSFYQRVENDAVLRHHYRDPDLSKAERHLRLFLIQYFGGPATYAEERGEPRLRRRHMPFVIGQADRDAWVRNMLEAMDEMQIPEPAYSTMKEYFEDAATFMVNATNIGG